MKCDKCSAKAVIHQKYSGMLLCRAHFSEDVHRKIRDTLRESRIFRQGTKIAVALNGSADSTTMAYVLKSLFSDREDVELFAIMIDEGIDVYRTEALACAKKLAEQLEMPFIVADAKEPCYVCESMRDEMLCRAAQELGADALAMGYSLDDCAGEIMLKYLRGDIDGLLSCANGIVPVIRPLRRVPAREIRLYARIHDLPFGPRPCMHVGRLRFDVMNELRDFEVKHPGTNYSLLRSIERIKDLQASARCDGAKPLSSDEK